MAISPETMLYQRSHQAHPGDLSPVCAFPYIIAFTSNTMEIRLVVNGNLIHTMSMPKLQLITSKNDIFFATTAPEFFPNKSDRLYVDIRQQELQKLSPPPSPNGKGCKLPKIPRANKWVFSISGSEAVEDLPYTHSRSQQNAASRPCKNMFASCLEVCWFQTSGKCSIFGRKGLLAIAVFRTQVPDQPRVSRSASSSPVPPVRAKLQPASIKW